MTAVNTYLDLLCCYVGLCDFFVFFDHTGLLLPSWKGFQEKMTKEQHSREEKVQNDYTAKEQQYICHVPMAIYCVGLVEVIIQRSVGHTVWFNFGSKRVL